MTKNVLNLVIIFLFGLVVGLAASFLIFQKEIVLESQEASLRAGLQESAEGEVVAHLMIDFGEGEMITCNHQELTGEKTVFGLLKVCSQHPEQPFALEYETYPELGVFIKQIGERISGDNERYWQYWVNNEFAQVGASQFELRGGEVVLWKFIKAKF